MARGLQYARLEVNMVIVWMYIVKMLAALPTMVMLSGIIGFVSALLAKSIGFVFAVICILACHPR